MATTNGKIAVNATATKLVDLDNVTQYVHLHSKGATYLGNAGVTTTTGFLLDNGDKLVITVPQGCELLNYRDWETDRKSTRLNSSHRL